MLLLKILLLPLIIGVGSLIQDTTSVKIYCPKKEQRNFKRCIIKQDQINNMAIQVNAKLDSIEFKWDLLLELIKNDTIQ